MSIGNIGLNIGLYEPWVRGKAYLKNLAEIESYSHVLSADWLYKSANIGINTDEADGIEWLINGLGRHIVVKNPGGAVVFVGFVNSITGTFGAVNYSIGPLVDIANRVLATYSPKLLMENYMATSGEIETVYAQDTDSQLIYGIWEKMIQAGECVVDPTTNYNEAEKTRDLFLKTFKNPKVTITTTNMGGGDISIGLDILGYSEWLKAYVYQNRLYTGSAATLITATAKIQAALADDPNTIFSTDYLKMQANASLQADKEEGYKTAYTVIEAATKVGDGTNRWLLWIDENNKIVYFPMSTDYYYSFRMTDNMQQFREYEPGNIVAPWDVLPGKYYFIQDTPLGLGNTNLFDIRRGFIEEVRYTAPYSVDVSGEPFNLFQAFVNQKAGGSF